jgi:hypothetical protein
MENTEKGVVTQRRSWPFVLLIATFVSGGFAGAVFNYFVSRPKDTVVTYRITTTTLASPDAAGLIPNLRLEIGSEAIQALYAHDVELVTSEGPFIDQAEIGVSFPSGARIYGMRTDPPSPMHSIVCKQGDNTFRCTIGPLSSAVVKPFRLTFAADQKEPPHVLIAAKSVVLAANALENQRPSLFGRLVYLARSVATGLGALLLAAGFISFFVNRAKRRRANSRP